LPCCPPDPFAGRVFFSGPVNWETVAVLAPATIVGGYAGARLARRLRNQVFKAVIVVFGTGIGPYLLVAALT